MLVRIAVYKATYVLQEVVDVDGLDQETLRTRPHCVLYFLAIANSGTEKNGSVSSIIAKPSAQIDPHSVVENPIEQD